MASTLSLLDAMNRVMRRVGMISSDLASLTDAARQADIDITVDILNEVLHELLRYGSLPEEVDEGTITLATGTRDYNLPSDFVQMSGDTYWKRALIFATDNRRIFEYRGGYNQMYVDQPDPSQFTGQPNAWAISPRASQIRMDREATSEEDGDAYTFLYDARQRLTAAADVFPFDDVVVLSIVPMAATLWRSDRDGKERGAISAVTGFGRALDLMTKNQRRRRYGPTTPQR